MKWAGWAVTAMLAMGSWFSAGGAERIVIDRVKIIVNNQMVTEREVDAVRDLLEREHRQTYRGSDLEEKLRDLDREVLDQLVENLLLEARAARLGIRIDDKEIEERVEAIIKRDPRVSAIYSDATLKDYIIRDLLRKRVLQREVTAHIFVDDKDVREACRKAKVENQEVDVGHILLRGFSDEVLKKLAALRRQLDAGAEFEELARANSEDPSAARNGGRLGFIARGQFVKPFEEKAFALAVGDLSAPVRTQFGYHLIKVFAKRSKEAIQCDKMDNLTHQRFQEQIFQKARRERMAKFIADLKQKAQIRILD